MDNLSIDNFKMDNLSTDNMSMNNFSIDNNMKMDNMSMDNIKTFFKSDMFKWILIIIGLSVLGFNIFKYFYQATDSVGKVAASGVSTSLDTVSQTLEMSGEGTKQLGKGASNVLTEIKDELDVHIANKESQQPKGDDNDSSIQMPKKSGYCYIGEDKGYRTCIEVGKRDTCMSGDIFPSLEVCINPNLRA